MPDPIYKIDNAKKLINLIRVQLDVEKELIYT